MDIESDTLTLPDTLHAMLRPEMVKLLDEPLVDSVWGCRLVWEAQHPAPYMAAL